MSATAPSGTRHAVVAVLAFAAAAYAIFLVTHVPQATATDNRWPINETEGVRLTGLSAGPLLTFTLQGSGLEAVTAEAGSSLTEPTAGTLKLEQAGSAFQPLPAGGPIDLRAANGDSSTAAVTVQLLPGGGGPSDVTVRPIVQHDQRGIIVEATNASLSAELDWSSEPPIKAGTGPLLIGTNGSTLRLGRAIVAVPAGKRLYIGAPLGSHLFLDIGSRPDNLSPGGIDVTRVETLSDEDGTSSLACAAKKIGALQWPRVTGGIRVSDCKGTLHVQNFILNEKPSFFLSGAAFTMTDGVTHYWPILADVTSNIVVQSALTAIVAALIGWIALSFRARSKRREGGQPKSTSLPQ